MADSLNYAEIERITQETERFTRAVAALSASPGS